MWYQLVKAIAAFWILFKMQLWPWLVGTTLMKIGDFQKCKIHSCSLRGFRITACQSWCNSQKVNKSIVFIGGAVFIWKYAIKKKNLIFENIKDMYQLWQAVILKPLKLGECILHFWKPPIFINLVPTDQGHGCILNT